LLKKVLVLFILSGRLRAYQSPSMHLEIARGAISTWAAFLKQAAHSIALPISSTTFFASPNTIIVLSM
jgi:hypothetical protein